MEREQYAIMARREERHWWYAGMRRVALAVLAGFLLAAILLAFLAFLLVGLGGAVLAHVEGIEQIVDGIAETRLVLDQPFQAIISTLPRNTDMIELSRT